jgi:hypothetical protein
MPPVLGFGTVTRILGGSRPRQVDTCLVCHQGVHEDEQRLGIGGGRYVHQGCSTYRMRAQASRRAR